MAVGELFISRKSCKTFENTVRNSKFVSPSELDWSLCHLSLMLGIPAIADLCTLYG